MTRKLITVFTLLFIFVGIMPADEKDDWYPLDQSKKALSKGKVDHAKLREAVKKLGEKVSEGSRTKIQRATDEVAASLSEAAMTRALLSDYSRLLERKATELYLQGSQVREKLTEREYDEAMSLVKKMRDIFGPLPESKDIKSEVSYYDSLFTKEDLVVVNKARKILER